MNIVPLVCTPCGGIETTKAAFQRLSCTPAGGRTLDTLIKSQVLYQLSYGSIVLWVLKMFKLLEITVEGEHISK